METVNKIGNGLLATLVFTLIMLGNCMILRAGFINAKIINTNHEFGIVYLFMIISLLLLIFTTTSISIMKERLSTSNLFFHMCALTSLFINYRIARYGAGEFFEFIFGNRLNFYHAPEISSALYSFFLVSLIILFSIVIKKIFTINV